MHQVNNGRLEVLRTEGVLPSYVRKLVSLIIVGRNGLAKPLPGKKIAENTSTHHELEPKWDIPASLWHGLTYDNFTSPEKHGITDRLRRGYDNWASFEQGL